jgi:hypothetical protein
MRGRLSGDPWAEIHAGRSFAAQGVRPNVEIVLSIERRPFAAGHLRFG